MFLCSNETQYSAIKLPFIFILSEFKSIGVIGIVMYYNDDDDNLL